LDRRFESSSQAARWQALLRGHAGNPQEESVEFECLTPLNIVVNLKEGVMGPVVFGFGMVLDSSSDKKPQSGKLGSTTELGTPVQDAFDALLITNLGRLPSWVVLVL
jgi:hypothetical protein